MPNNEDKNKKEEIIPTRATSSTGIRALRTFKEDALLAQGKQIPQPEEKKENE